MSVQADKYTLNFPRPLTTVDLAVFTIREDRLQVLLLKRPADQQDPYPNMSALPGGFVDIEKDSSLLDTAKRKLFEKTGVKTPYLEQVGSWGDANRDPRGWSATHLYFALIADPSEKQEISKDVHWTNVSFPWRGGRLAFDHQQLLKHAITRLRSKVEYTSLPAYLLPEPFTLPELHRTYEIVLDRSIDKSSFRTRTLAADFLQETGLLKSEGPRPAMGHKLKNRKELVYFPRPLSGKGD